MTPKISVITPLYNTPEAFLRPMIESILNQTYKDFEFLILNDSPDNKEIGQIVKSYNDPRIRYWENDRNLGISESHNILFKASQGEYIAIFDHDDISMINRLEEEKNILDNNPNIGVVSSCTREISTGKITKCPENNIDIKRALLRDCVISHSASMIRKSVMLKHGIKWENTYTPAEDYMLWVRLIAVTMFHIIQEPLIEYRDHPYDRKTKEKMRDAAHLVRCFALKEYPFLAKRDRWIYLFGCIPFLKIQNRESGSVCGKIQLFGLIPIFYIK